MMTSDRYRGIFEFGEQQVDVGIIITRQTSDYIKVQTSKSYCMKAFYGKEAPIHKTQAFRVGIISLGKEESEAWRLADPPPQLRKYEQSIL